MLPGRDGRTSYGSGRFPQHFSALILPASLKNKASHCSGALEMGKGSEQSLDLCKTDCTNCTLSALMFPAEDLQHWRDLPLRHVFGAGPL